MREAGLQHLRLEKCLWDILREYPQGISEYQLIVILQNIPYEIFAKTAMSETLTLFQSHFVLFHNLYQLRAQGLTAQQYDLHITATNIKILPFVAQAAGMRAVDKLQNYYLDWQNFSVTNKQDVESLLDQFWTTMAGSNKHFGSDGGVLDEVTLNKITEAYKTFDLPFDSELKRVKSTYLRLQHRHHPDKGGDKKRSQQLEGQFQLLKAYLSKN